MKIDGKVKGQNILYRADCKEALQRLIEKDVSVDLIYLDPPFNSNRNYNVIYKSRGGVSAQQKAFGDTWKYGKETQNMLEGFRKYLSESNVSNEVKIFLEAMLDSLSKLSKHNSLLAYLIYMAERLVLCHKILKDTGSIYYHCDPTASHYIKVIMDGVFGNENFRNEIIWCYNRFSRGKNTFPSMHDTILFYTKKNDFYFKAQYTEARNTKRYEKGYHTVVDKGVKKLLIYDKNKVNEAKKLKYDGVVYTDSKKPILGNNWSDIAPLNSQSKERVEGAYPTQKPTVLLDRIIEASCPEKGVILDPFCGCGTTIASALKSKRKWVGVDISIVAINIIKDRIGKKNDGVKSIEYREFDGNPETRDEYDSFTPFQKQDFLVSRIGGIPSPVHTGDGGVDGELQIFLGEQEGKDLWGDLIFSVKTGKQRAPDMVRELIGTMDDKKADMGILILEADPTDEME